MKILYFITRSDVIGGASIHLIDLALGMKARGHDVIIFSGGSGVFTDFAKQKGLSVFSLNYLKRDLNIFLDSKAFFEILNVIKLHNPDLVHSHSTKAGILGRLCCFILKIPNVFTAHGWSFTDGIPFLRRNFYLLIEKFVGLFSDHIITVSEYDRQLALSYRIASPSKISTIVNGVHDLYTPSSFSGIHDPIKLVMVARFDHPKDHLLLVNALHSLRHLPFTMYFVGDGPLLNSVSDFVSNLSSSDKFFFLGSRNDIVDILSSMDLFILISKWEGLPLTILEAMSCHLPILASNVGGVSEAVIPGENGWLIPKDDLNTLTDRLSYILTSPSCLNYMGTNSRNIFKSKFLIDYFLNKTERLYFSLLSK